MNQLTLGKEKLGILYVASFLGNFDRIVIIPLLVPAAQTFHVGLGSVTLALTAYLLLFGIMQPVYGLISDVVGRVPVMAVALAGLGVANLVAALAPNVGMLIVGRALAGAAASALLPIAVAYIGDRVPFERRQRTVATLLSVGAAGVAVATVAAGVLTHLLSWRAAIGVTALAAPMVAVLVARLPEAFTRPTARPTLSARLGRAFSRGWFRFLVALAFVEGAAMLGFFNFFAPALQAHGKTVVITGLVTGSYGLAAVAGGYLVRVVGPRVSAAAFFGLGGTLLTAGYLVAAYRQTIVTILAASVLSGLAFAFVQSTIQTWATEVAPPEARGIATSLVACSVFTGAAVGAVAVGGLAADRQYGLLFLIAAVVTMPVVIVGTVARARFSLVCARLPPDHRRAWGMLTTRGRHRRPRRRANGIRLNRWRSSPGATPR